MRTNKEYRRMAREMMMGNFGLVIKALIVIDLLTSLFSFPFAMMMPVHPSITQNIVFYVSRVLILILSEVLTIGCLKIHLNIARKQPAQVSLIFFGYKHRPNRFLATSAIMSILDMIAMAPMLWGYEQVYREIMDDSISLQTVGIVALLFILSGILLLILNLYLGLFYFLILDYPNATIGQCFTHSVELMRGHKGKLFSLLLGFIGLAFLSVLSFGIGLLWVVPYMNQTMTIFYFDVKGEVSSFEEDAKASSFNQYV